MMMESIITNERYIYIAKLMNRFYNKRTGKLTASDKIDRVVTNRFWLCQFCDHNVLGLLHLRFNIGNGIDGLG